MEVSKLVISEETMNKAQKKLGKTKKSELRMEKLRQLAKSGRLAMIRNRGDLAEAVGYSYQERHSLGYQWVHYKIKRGVLKETFLGYQDGKPEYEYEMISEQPAVITTKPAEAQVVENPVENPATIMTIYKGDITIALDNVKDNTIVEIVKTIMKGE